MSSVKLFYTGQINFASIRKFLCASQSNWQVYYVPEIRNASIEWIILELLLIVCESLIGSLKNMRKFKMKTVRIFMIEHVFICNMYLSEYIFKVHIK